MRLLKNLLLTSAAAPIAFFATPASAQTCPSFGASSDCSAVITITDRGSSITFSGIGPYDSIEDTMVGVINKSSQPIYALGLNSITDIFGFDGDGINTYGAPGNSQDTTGYGGPNAYFSNIGAGAQSGVVNFVNPLAANGGTTYFSLEEALTKPTAIQDIVNGSISVNLGGRFNGTAFGALNLFRPTNITGVFTPNGGITLAQAAAQTGFIGFDFQQTITRWPNADLHQAGTGTALTAPPSFYDPPPGGYDYCVTIGWTECQTSYPFYPTTKTANTVTLFDSPRDPLLTAGQSLDFKVRLIGLLPSYVPGTDCLNLAIPTCVDLGVGFNWQSTYNGSYGGIAMTASNLPIDPSTADGTGGVTLLNVLNNSTYSPFQVTSVNGILVPVVPPSTPIDGSQPFFLASLLGGGVDPDFQGGTLRMDGVGQTYGQNFTVNGLGATFDAFGNQSTFTGDFTDTSGTVPGAVLLTDSVGGGSILFTGALGASDKPLGPLTNLTNLTFGPNAVGWFQGVLNVGMLTNNGVINDALINLGTLVNNGTYNADVDNANTGIIVNNGTWNGKLGNTVANAGMVTNAGLWTGDADNAGALFNSGTWTGAATNEALGVLGNTGTISGAVINAGIASNSGSIGGSVTNSGTLTTTGSIGGGLVNTGSVLAQGTINGAVTNGGTITVTGALAGDGAWTNAGLIDLRNGATGNNLTLGGGYSGAAGSRIALDVNMGTKVPAADRVVATSLSGTSAVTIVNLGAKKVYFADPVVLVRAGGGSGTLTAAADAATNAALASRGIVDFGFQKLAGGGNSYGLVAKVNTGAASQVAGQASAYLNALNFGGFADGREIDGLAFDGGKWRGQFWTRSIASSDEYERVSHASDAYSPVASAQSDVRQTGVQFGADWAVWKAGSDRRLRLGVTGGYSNGEVRDQLKSTFRSPFYGGYVILTDGGAMLDAQYERIETKIIPPSALVSGRLKGHVDRLALGFSLRRAIGSLTAEPFVRYAYAKLSLPDAVLAAGEGTLSFRQLKSELVQAGLKVMHTERLGAASLVPWFSASYVHETGTNARTLFNPDGGAGAVTIDDHRRGGYGDFALGLNLRSRTSGIEAFVRGEGRAGPGDHGYGATAGARLRF